VAVDVLGLSALAPAIVNHQVDHHDGDEHQERDGQCGNVKKDRVDFVRKLEAPPNIVVYLNR